MGLHVKFALSPEMKYLTAVRKELPWGVWDLQPTVSSSADLHSFPQGRDTSGESLRERPINGENSTVPYHSEISVCFRASVTHWLLHGCLCIVHMIIT